MSYLIGDIIKKLRNKKNLNQEELAKKIGIKKITIQRWESDKNSPPYDKLRKLLDVLDANLYDIAEPKYIYETIKSTQEIFEITDDSLLFAGVKKKDKLVFDTLIDFSKIDENALYIIKIEDKIFVRMLKSTPGGTLLCHAGDPSKHEIKILPKSQFEILGKVIKLIRNFN